MWQTNILSWWMISALPYQPNVCCCCRGCSQISGSKDQTHDCYHHSTYLPGSMAASTRHDSKTCLQVLTSTSGLSHVLHISGDGVISSIFHSKRIAKEEHFSNQSELETFQRSWHRQSSWCLFSNWFYSCTFQKYSTTTGDRCEVLCMRWMDIRSSLESLQGAQHFTIDICPELLSSHVSTMLSRMGWMRISLFTNQCTSKKSTAMYSMQRCQT